MANHNPVITNTLPTWVFIQSTASGNYRHEIQRVPSGFMVFVNVSVSTARASLQTINKPYIIDPIKY